MELTFRRINGSDWDIASSKIEESNCVARFLVRRSRVIRSRYSSDLHQSQNRNRAWSIYSKYIYFVLKQKHTKLLENSFQLV